jgi:hypothetical protein
MIWRLSSEELARVLVLMLKKLKQRKAVQISDPRWQSPQKKHVKPIIGFVLRTMETFSITKGLIHSSTISKQSNAS